MDSIFAPPRKLGPQERVIQAAEAALQYQHEVTPIEVFCRLQLLYENHVAHWRRGGVQALDELMQGGPEKGGKGIRILDRWAQERRLKPVTGRYTRATCDGEQELRFTGAKFPGVEEAFRTHYAPADLPEKKQKTIEARANRAPERVVFSNLRDSTCSECGVPIPARSFLFMDAGEPLCLPCANLGDLEFLARGDTAMTRRATKYSGERRAVVVQFSRSRGRYERQGILVTEAALRQAEEECSADAPERARQRERAAVARAQEDAVFVESFTAAIRELLPRCPEDEARGIAAHAGLRGSGRVGRSEAGRQLGRNAVKLAIVAALRHNHTDYDELLAAGVDRADARARVRPKIDDVLEHWGGSGLI